MVDANSGILQAIGSGLQEWSSNLLASVFIVFAVALLLLLSLTIALWLRGARARRTMQALEHSQHQLQGLVDTAGQQLDELKQQLIVADNRRQAIEVESASLAKAAELKDIELQRYREQLTSATEQLNDVEKNYASLVAKSRAEQVAMEEKLALLQQNRQQLTHEFESLANKIFEEKNAQHSKASQAQLDATLSPLKNQLESFRKRVDDVYSQESKERHVLQDQIKKLREESLRISEDATNLTNALKFDNKTQGNWGELTLIRALEMCGLREPHEYETQVAFKADSGEGLAGRTQIPDVIVHLPGGKDIIIDSKVSLVAYSRFFEAKTQEEKDTAVKQHLLSIKNHIKQLSGKSYQHLPGVHTLDYVMLYIPIEGAAAMALQSHEGLWEEAYAKNIVLVSPTNLLAILRSVETIWRHEKQNSNAEEIARQAGLLHDKFLNLIKSLEAVGKAIESARKSYDTAYGQLSAGRGNLVSKVKQLEALGAKTKQAIPAHLQQAAEDEDSDEIAVADELARRLSRVRDVDTSDGGVSEPAQTGLEVETELESEKSTD